MPRVMWLVTLAGALAVTTPLVLYLVLRQSVARDIFSPNTAPAAPVAIIFGAGYGSRGPSAVLRDRVETGAALYHARRVRKLLMTGDNSHHDYNEPAVMRRLAIGLGVPREDIVLDFAGFRTYDSLYRARSIFGVRSALLVTQSFHLPRALYTANRLGIHARGVSADRTNYLRERYWHVREFFALQAAWIELNLLRRPPRYLGKAEPIFASRAVTERP